jgi:inosine/xanthosine triphosphate pyrophosphatase family protein/adenylate kinase family enzyme
MLEIIFITSSKAKLAHAKHVCRDYAVQISKQRHYGIGYTEPRIHDRQELIYQSVKDAIERCEKNIPNAKNKFFIIEDTSVKIHALSNEEEYPGVDIKYWMQENDFLSIDKQLKNLGSNRQVTVRSDLVLILPSSIQKQIKGTYITFTSSVSGNISEKEYEIKTQPLYPWLSSITFDKWFIPKGCEIPLSALPIEMADLHDFRAGAFKEMLHFLEKNKIIRKKRIQKEVLRQGILFPKPDLFIVCGTTCAGKTLLATHLLKNYNYYHIEASDFMYLSYYERHGVDSSVRIGNFAEQALRVNPGIVVDQIIKHIESLGDILIIITGFRSPDEIKCFKQQYRGSLNIEYVFIDAERKTRYLRSQQRNRHNNKQSREGFNTDNQQQENMGLSTLRKELTLSTIENNGSIEDYFEAFRDRYKKRLNSLGNATNFDLKSSLKPRRLEDEIILVLAEKFESDKYYTTTEIAHLINEAFAYSTHPKSKNNVSRHFNQYFRPYYEINLKSGKRYYRLSQTGLGRAHWLMRHMGPHLGCDLLLSSFSLLHTV